MKTQHLLSTFVETQKRPSTEGPGGRGQAGKILKRVRICL